MILSIFLGTLLQVSVVHETGSTVKLSIALNFNKIFQKNGGSCQNGRDGRDGHDGRNGLDGRNGRDGYNGKDGKNGMDCRAKRNWRECAWNNIDDGRDYGLIKVCTGE